MELYNNNDILLEIERDALKKLIFCVKRNPLLEAGGVLLGKKRIDSEAYLITDIGVPTRYDKQGPMSFVRSMISARQHINSAWQNSGGFVNHIGEWHSHIFDSPYPSLQDKRDMERAYIDGEYVFDCFFTVIVSRDLQIYTGLAVRGKIIDYNIIKAGQELCMDTAWERVMKAEKRKL